MSWWLCMSLNITQNQLHHHQSLPPLLLSPPPLSPTTTTITTTVTTTTIVTTTTAHHHHVNSPNDAFGNHLTLWSNAPKPCQSVTSLSKMLGHCDILDCCKILYLQLLVDKEIFWGPNRFKCLPGSLIWMGMTQNLALSILNTWTSSSALLYSSTLVDICQK